MSEIDWVEVDEEMDPITKEIVEKAKYWTATVYLGRGKTDRRVLPDRDAAEAMAKQMHEEYKRGALIYAVADIPGASDFGRCVCSYPYQPFVTSKMAKRRQERRRSE